MKLRELQGSEVHGAQHHRLDGDARPERHGDAPLAAAPLPLAARAPQLVEHEEHRRSGHVPELAQHAAARRQLPGRQRQPRLHAVQDRAPAGVHRPEQPVPAAAAVDVDVDADAERGERVGDAVGDVLADEGRHLVGDVVVEAALPELPGDGVLGARDGGLGRGRHVEDGALDGDDRVGADDGGAGAVAEDPLQDERVEAAILRAAERDEVELGAGHQDARAGGVLGEVLGQAERAGAGGAAAEVQQRAAHGGAEAEEPRQADVGADHVAAGVGGDDQMGDVAGRAAPLRDGLPRRRRRELRDGGGGDVAARVQRRLRAAGEVWVVGEQLLGEVEMALIDAGFVTCKKELSHANKGNFVSWQKLDGKSWRCKIFLL
mgnify:CR=1 FL=1